MNVFTWLLVGHLVGDWVFQNDWMAKGKQQALVTWAGMTHFAIYTAVIIGAVWLSRAGEPTPLKCVGLGIFIFVTHWLVDAARLADHWIRLYRQSNLELVRVMVDQTFHVVTLVIAAILIG